MLEFKRVLVFICVWSSFHWCGLALHPCRTTWFAPFLHDVLDRRRRWSEWRRADGRSQWTTSVQCLPDE